MKEATHAHVYGRELSNVHLEKSKSLKKMKTFLRFKSNLLCWLT